MSLVIHIYYTGQNGNARKFAQEMISKGIVDRIRQEEGNEGYEYFYPVSDEETVLLIDRWSKQEALDFHHRSEMMKEISDLKKKYHLSMRMEKLTEWHL